jgi:TIR domain
MTRNVAVEGSSQRVTYDGFLCYSHAADDRVAPRVQAALQQFAKPWWRRRAVRIFRDETTLPAGPRLWTSITQAIDHSAWCVMLLSPEAAQSDWVSQETRYWLEHKSGERIIPVVTGGEFGWDGGDLDRNSTAAPAALFGAFREEPRWVDLRFAKTEEQLDLSHPRFAAAIADIAAAMRGVPKDELESEEVRQHRRTVRTAVAAGIALLLLVFLAAAAAVYAIDQRNDALLALQQAAWQANLAAAAQGHAEDLEGVIYDLEELTAMSQSELLELAAALKVGVDDKTEPELVDAILQAQEPIEAILRGCCWIR